MDISGYYFISFLNISLPSEWNLILFSKINEMKNGISAIKGDAEEILNDLC